MAKKFFIDAFGRDGAPESDKLLTATEAVHRADELADDGYREQIYRHGKKIISAERLHLLMFREG